ncbi:MAG: HAMP domain-containing histidine kinase [Prevotellaceae bacterium]|jgi:signal transduction histidine kinase|nr:HAMP domain-containing histidine kinase [Prevotellaceae bacterium]
MSNELIYTLNGELLNASTWKGQELFDCVVNAIQETTNCRMCSLWSINYNTGNRTISRSASLIVRKLEKGQIYPGKNREDFVNDLKDACLIKDVLQKTEKTRQPYHCFDIQECENHKSKESIDKLGLKYFIGIPIPNQENKIIAVLKLFFVDKPAIQPLELFATTIRDVISSCFFRYVLYNRQQVMEDLMKNYQEKGTERNLENIFNPILGNILYNYCKYEGASIFIWDSYMNYYNLLSTTGIERTDDRQTVFYLAGEGLTGKAAGERKRPMMYDNLYEEENNPDYMHKFREITNNPSKTMMVIPIFRPSVKDEVIGIIRFVNKQNNANREVVDYFNDSDAEIMSYASNYLALTIDYFLGEKERNNFISKISHEFRTPANTIRITADRLLKNEEDESFIERYFNSYMEAILYSAELQIQQATTSLYMSKTRTNIPRSEKYILSKTSLKDILYKSRTTVIPIAREMRVKFNNIIIDIPAWHLFIDEFAFTTVFYNLLTNTIKYRNNDFDFHVNISGYETSSNFIINVSDYGLGIAPEDSSKIFLLGFRGKNVAKKDTGFGIGLSVVKQIINDFGGEIKVASFKSPTRFEIKLPKYLSDDNYSKTEIWNSK